MRTFIMALAALSMCECVFGSDLSLAPPDFLYQGKRVVPIDILNQTLKIVLDVNQQGKKAEASIDFLTEKDGFPMLDLVPNATQVEVDGKSANLQLISSPDGGSSFRMIDKEVLAGTHKLVIHYNLSSESITFTQGGVRLGFFMDDVGAERGFLEQYAPSNFEFDAFKLVLTVQLVNARNQHRIFTTGEIKERASSEWEISFPDYFTTSSFYFHITDAPFSVLESNYQGLSNNIPIQVYGSGSSLTNSAMSKAKNVLNELEKDYGPFAHSRLVIYAKDSGGGMEYCGATVSSVSALGHELTHSWFARGVMPASGNAGWIDEAIASWRGNGYPRAQGAPSRSSVNLAAFSHFRRRTPNAAYEEGAELMSEFHYLFQDGMKPILRKLFDTYKYKAISTEIFKDFLEETTGQSLDAIFNRYVYGRSYFSKKIKIIPDFFIPVEVINRKISKEEYINLR